MRQVKFGQSDKHTITGMSLTGFVINAYLVHTTVNTAFVLTTNIVDFAQILVSCTLKRNGRTITVFNDVLYPLAQESNFLGGNYDEIRENTCAPQVLVVQTASLFHTVLMSSDINLHAVINLSGSDQIDFEITPNLAGPIATVSQANSWIEWDYKEGVGNSLSVPVIRAESVRAAETTTNIPLGDNVVSATFINKDKVGVTLANQVLQFFNLTSDKLNRTDMYTEMLAKRAGQFPSTALSQTRDQSFKLFDLSDKEDCKSSYDARLHKANIRLSFVSANVNAGKNFLVVRAYENDNETLAKAAERDARHRDQNAVQYVA